MLYFQSRVYSVCLLSWQMIKYLNCCYYQYNVNVVCGRTLLPNPNLLCWGWQVGWQRNNQQRVQFSFFCSCEVNINKQRGSSEFSVFPVARTFENSLLLLYMDHRTQWMPNFVPAKILQTKNSNKIFWMGLFCLMCKTKYIFHVVPTLIFHSTKISHPLIAGGIHHQQSLHKGQAMKANSATGSILNHNSNHSLSCGCFG